MKNKRERIYDVYECYSNIDVSMWMFMCILRCCRCEIREKDLKKCSRGTYFLKEWFIMRGIVIFLLVLMSLLVIIFICILWIIEVTRKEMIEREKSIDN